jgi:hypothetical protein
MAEVTSGLGSIVERDDIFYHILLIQGFYLAVGVEIKSVVAKDAFG